MTKNNDDGIVPAEDIVSADPVLIPVRANVTVLGLEVGDVVEIEATTLIRGLIEIGHLTEMQGK